MPQAQFVQAGEVIDYCPLASVRAGDVIVLGERVLVAVRSIEPGEHGSLATAGAFDVAKTADTFQIGSPVYWNSAVAPIGDAASGAAVASENDGVYMGYAVLDAPANVPKVRVLLGASVATTGSQGPRIVWDEVPQMLGNNQWRLSQTPAPGKLMLFRNGLLQREGLANDFVLTGRDIAFNAGNEPQPGDILSATYLPL